MLGLTDVVRWRFVSPVETHSVSVEFPVARVSVGTTSDCTEQWHNDVSRRRGGAVVLRRRGASDIVKTSIGLNVSGGRELDEAPAFVFMRLRPAATDPAVIQIP